MNRLQKIFKDMPHTTGQVEIKHIAVVNLGDGVDVVPFESHGEERQLQNPVEYIGTVNRAMRDYF